MISCFPYLNPLYILFSSPQPTTPPPHPTLPQQHVRPIDIQYSSCSPPTCPQKCEGMCPHLPAPAGGKTRVNGQESHAKSDSKGEVVPTPRVFGVHEVDGSSVRTAQVSGGEAVTTAHGDYGIQPDAGRQLVHDGDGNKLQEAEMSPQTHRALMSSPGDKIKDNDANVDIDDLSSLIDDDEDNNKESLRLSIVDMDGKDKEEGKGMLGHVFFF